MCVGGLIVQLSPLFFSFFFFFFLFRFKMSTFNALRLFLLSTSVVELVFAGLSLNNHALALASGCFISVQAFLALTFVTSVLFGHLAFDQSNKGLYRVSLWSFLGQLILVTSLHLNSPGSLSTFGLLVATIAATGFAWLTLTYKDNLYPQKAAADHQKAAAPSSPKKAAPAKSPSAARGRSRTPKRK